jgi:hypothetical protein
MSDASHDIHTISSILVHYTDHRRRILWYIGCRVNSIYSLHTPAPPVTTNVPLFFPVFDEVASRSLERLLRRGALFRLGLLVGSLDGYKRRSDLVRYSSQDLVPTLGRDPRYMKHPDPIGMRQSEWRVISCFNLYLLPLLVISKPSCSYNARSNQNEKL